MTSEGSRASAFGGGGLRELGWMLGLALLTVLAYRGTLTYWWTGPDTFTLINTSRIGSWGDLWALLTQPMMSESRFLEIGRFFRPTTGLSYALDWQLWGMDPTGYHVTNLLLHTLAVVFTYALARWLLSGEQRWPAALAAAVLALHPVVAESLPAISRRQDALVTTLLLAALLAYLAASRRTGRVRTAYQATSLTLALLAYGAKEVALVLPGLVLAHAWLLDDQAPGPPVSGRRATWSLARATPHLVLWGLFLAWRGLVLGGIGGYADRPALLSPLVAWHIGQYVTALLPPLRYLQLTLGLSGQGVLALFAVTLLLLVGLTYVAYRGRRATFQKDVRRLLATRAGRVTAFSLVWLTGGGALFLAGRAFTLWSAYLFVVPLALLISALLTTTLPILAGTWRPDPRSPRRSRGPRDRPDPRGLRDLFAGGTAPALLATLLLAGTVASAVVLSPGVWGEEDWAINGEISRQVLPAISQAIQAHGEELTTVHTEHLLWYHAIATGDPTRVESVFYWKDFTVEDYVALDTQGRHQVDVVVQHEAVLDRWPADLDVELSPIDGQPGHAELVIRIEPPPPS